MCEIDLRITTYLGCLLYFGSNVAIHNFVVRFDIVVIHTQNRKLDVPQPYHRTTLFFNPHYILKFFVILADSISSKSVIV